MLLRSITEHVKNQNWFAVGIDFAIVVIGVFVGIQVSNWNEARVERGVADRHLGEIAEDLQAHLDFHGALYGSAVARIAAADYLIEAAGFDALPDTLTLSVTTFIAPETPEVREEDLDNILGWLNLVRVTVSTRNGYESLISSGNLGLLRNRDLARQIQQYYGRYDDLLDTQKVFREFRSEGGRAAYSYGLSLFDQRPIEDVVAVVREHEAFAAYVRTTREWAMAHANMLEDLRVETEALLAAIRQELANGGDGSVAREM